MRTDPQRGSVVTLAKEGGESEHERSVAVLMKMQAMDECDERWRVRAEGWQQEVREGSERIVDLTSRLQHAQGQRARLEDSLRGERNTSLALRSNDRTESLLHELSKRDASIHTLNETLRTLTEKLASLEEANSTLKSQKQHDNNATISEVKLELKQMQKERDDAQSSAVSAQKEAAAMTERLAHQQQGLLLCEGAVKETQQREHSVEARLRVDREKYAAVIKELRAELEQVEGRRRADKHTFRDSIEQLKQEMQHLQLLNNTHMKEAESLRALPKQLQEREREVASLRRQVEERDVPFKRPEIPDATDHVCYEAPWNGGGRAEPLAQGDAKQRVLEERVAALQARAEALAKENTVLREERSQLSHDKAEWKYRALLATPTSMRCNTCGAQVTLWPEHSHPDLKAPLKPEHRERERERIAMVH